MKKLIAAAALSLSAVTVASAPAFADTYAVVINGLKQPISLGGATIKPGDSAWTPLNATLVMPNRSFASIKDMNRKDSRGRWLIQSQATQSVSYYIPLKFAEVGCIAALVNNAGTDTAPRYRIDMQKMAGGRCADNWWQKGGKDTITQAVGWLQTAQKNALDALTLIAK
ncbi:MAG: hypothetical protein MH252_02285 [Thermosynechococcaceae cyanobacterium MS004]|nr:hypothetical protein [Thermosynechococcaceae cyanobacterium MS004]